MSRAENGQAAHEADFVIVGGGSAGCVLAARLSEDPSVQIVLIEAGRRDKSPYIHLPVTYYKTTGPQFTWGYKTAPSRHQGGISTGFAQARVLGGGSSINAQVYMRGTPQDYDDWRDAFGCEGWGYSEVLPYFIKSEDNSRLAGDLHGTNGPLKVSDQAYTHPLTYAWIKACQEAGLPFNPDFNSGSQAGCGPYQVTNRTGRRSSAANCYLHPVEHRANLKVLTDAQVARVVTENGRARGVVIAGPGGDEQMVSARREVILTAGAIGSPQILMLSGIGPAAHLQDVGIEPKRDLPGVGENLQDHLDIFMVYQLTGPHSYDKYKSPLWQIWAGLQFALFRSGPVTSNVVEGGAFWWVDESDPQPDVQFHFLAGAGVEEGIEGVPGGNGCTLNAYLVRPQSRGTVRLKDNHPRSAPVIDPNYLSEDADLKKTIDSVRLGRQIMRQPALRPFVADEHFPGANANSQDALEDFVRAEARTGYHPAGTCRMGSGPDSVVDTELKVHGVAGLRVADNSIMPRLVSGNTNATAIMIGERAADFIKREHRLS